MPQGIMFNGAQPTTAAQVKAALGTSIKTQLQVKPTGGALWVAEWSIHIDAVVAFGTVELLETDVAATSLTAQAPYAYGNDPDGVVAALAPSGTSASGYGAGAEGTITATRVFDTAIMGPVTQYKCQFPLGKRPCVLKNKFLRIRTTMSAAVNGICWVVLDTEA